MRWPLPIFQPPRWAVGCLLTLLAGALGTLSHFASHRPLINDEAVELLQSEGLPTDRFYFLMPDTAYPLNTVDTVETLAPYLNHLLFQTAPGLVTRERFLIPVRLLCIAGFMGACSLFYRIAHSWWSPSQAALAGICLATSAYALLMNQFVTRNSLSLFWAMLLVYVLSRWLKGDRLPSVSAAWPWVISSALALVLGCWTYTSFKLMAVAIYGGLFAVWLRFDRRWTALLTPIASGLLFASMLAGLILADGKGFALYFVRGAYALAGVEQYLRLLALTLISPFYYTAHGGFVEEDIHVLIGRAPLSPLLGPFFLIGWGCALVSRRPFWFWTSIAWLIGMVLCALGGPNLKYLHAFFPLMLLLALRGVFTVSDWLATIRPAWPRYAVPILVCAYVGLEVWHLFVVIPRSDYFEMNAIPKKIAQAALEEVQHKDENVLAQPGVGFDILNWYLWPAKKAARVRRWPTVQIMLADLAAGPPLGQDTVLVVDYPVREVCTKEGKSLSEALRIIDVREP